MRRNGCALPFAFFFGAALHSYAVGKVKPNAGPSRFGDSPLARAARRYAETSRRSSTEYRFPCRPQPCRRSSTTRLRNFFKSSIDYSFDADLSATAGATIGDQVVISTTCEGEQVLLTDVLSRAVVPTVSFICWSAHYTVIHRQV